MDFPAADFSLRDKIALVTGANKGLGQAMAVALAQSGADIVALGRQEMTGTEELVKEAGSSFAWVRGDLSSPKTVKDLAAQAIAAFGRIDILVNNAGVTPVRPAEEYSEGDFDLVMDVNVKSLYFLSQEIGKAMIRQGGGKIINVCSVQSMKGGNSVSVYVASKHAVAGITKALANEWAKYGINVNGIAPGYMVTDNTAGLRQQRELTASLTQQIPMGRWGSPADMMGPVVFLASEASRYVNGHLLVVDGGYLNN